MKKFLLIVLALAVGMASVDAKKKSDENEVKDPARFRPKYRNLSWSSQKVGMEGISLSNVESSKFGAAFNFGRSFIVHKNPVAGMLRFGIDATWLDMNYGNWGGEGLAMHKVDIGMGVGVGIHVNPVSKLGVHAYFRYNPTATAMVSVGDGDIFASAGYSSYFTSGATVNWSVIGLGFEGRFGGGNLKTVKASEEEMEASSGKMKHKLGGWRAYVSFRF